jgi:putative redox protein
VLNLSKIEMHCDNVPAHPMANESHIRATWRERLTFDAATDAGHAVTMDSSVPHGGDDRGPSPMEMLLIALAGCAGRTVLDILLKKREPVHGLEVSVTGRRAETHPKVYTHIEMSFRVAGDVRRESIERAIELAETKYCPVSVMLAETAVMAHSIEIVEA